MTVDDTLQDRLRGADPAASLSPADPTRVARLLEDTMATAPDAAARRRWPAWLAAAAAVAVVAGGMFWLADRGGDSPAPVAEPAPTLTTLGAPTAGAGKCMVPTAELLGTQTLAVDGTVTDLTDGVATLEVTRWYAGEPTDLLRVEAPAEDLTALVGAVHFEVGQRYLVAGTSEGLAACGMSGAYSPELAALYSEAFGDR
jgi:hypothetical protein